MVRARALETVSCHNTLHLTEPKDAQKFASDSFNPKGSSLTLPHRANQKEVELARKKPSALTITWHELPKTS